MREIKFRAWFTLTKRMVEHEYLSLAYDYADGFTTAFDHLTFDGEQLEKGTFNFELMQYTGLTDRKGKEIYEGDIVELECDCDPGDYVVCNHPNWRGVVEWDAENSSFELNGIPRNKWNNEAFEKSMEDQYEIVGNRFESPELLKGE